MACRSVLQELGILKFIVSHRHFTDLDQDFAKPANIENTANYKEAKAAPPAVVTFGVAAPSHQACFAMR